MKKLLITSKGRYQVIEESLTDSSKVYSVEFPSDDGGLIVFACISRDAAYRTAELLVTTVIDVSLRDLPEAA